LGGTAAEVLKRVFETDQIRFSTCSLTLPRPEEQCCRAQEMRRDFASVTQAAEENGLSHILVWIHFRKAVEEGIAHGRKIANRAVNHIVRPVD
jgi:hypothetical protein